MHLTDPIDRISPALEPDQPVLMYQTWHHLLFLHWEVPPVELQALLPPGLTLDTFEGKAYVGLVPFHVTGARPIMTPAIPAISNFPEINVRTYVHHKGSSPGVWFFSLDASSTIAVAAARAAFKLPYFRARMEFNATAAALPQISIVSHRDDDRGPTPAHANIRYAPSEGPTRVAALGTLEHFLIERYVLYAQDEEHHLYRARVHHVPYPIQKVEVQGLDETLVWAAGVRRSEAMPIRHYASEVDVKVYPPERVGSV